MKMVKRLFVGLFLVLVASLASAHCGQISPVLGVQYYGVTQFRQVGKPFGAGDLKAEPNIVLTTQVRFDANGYAHPFLVLVIGGEEWPWQSPAVPYTVSGCQVRFSVPNIPILDKTITNNYTLTMRVPNKKTWQAARLDGYVVIPEWGAEFSQGLGFGHWE